MAKQVYSVVKTNGERELLIARFPSLVKASECVDRLKSQLHLTPGYRYLIEIKGD